MSNVNQQAGAAGASEGQWVRCTPNLINAGVSCAKTPRRDGDGSYSHDHFISHATPAPTDTGAAGASEVKPWRERLAEDTIGAQPAMHFADAEIADLRAQLAQCAAESAKWAAATGAAHAQLARQRQDGHQAFKLAVEWQNRAKQLEAELAEARQRQGSGEPVVPSFDCSLASTDAHDPQSFIDGAKWAQDKLLTTPAPQAQGEPVLYVRQMDLDHSKQYPQRSVITTPLAGDDWSVPLYTGPTAQADEVRDAALDGWKHATNEWADAACNGLQWLRNIEDGTTTDIKRARENMEQSCAHARQVSDALRTTAADNHTGDTK